MDVQSRHFTIEPLGDGLWAAVASPEGGALCNSAIVDLGDRTLVFDTCATLPAARDLRAAAEALTGRPVSYAVNSHVHPDHVHGNVVFAETAVLIASEVTRAAIAARGLQWMEQMRGELNGRLPGYPDPADLRVPDLAFAGALTFHGSRRSARLIDLGVGHSESDTILHLPEDGVLFAGDLVTDGNQILCYGDPEALLANLDRLEELPVQTLVPGHGPVMEPGPAIARVRTYIQDLLARVSAAVAGGAGEELAEQWPVPAGCGEYWFRENVRFLVRRHQRLGQSPRCNRYF